MTQTTQTRYLYDLYQGWNARLNAGPLDMETTRDIFEEWHLPTIEPTGVTYEVVDAGGVEAMWCAPVGAREDRVILYFHGGGGVVGSMHTHRKLAGHIAKEAGVRALVLNYRLAPEHPFPAQVEDGVAAYRWLLENGFEGAHIATAGDSAGGAFAISTVVRLRELGEPLPAGVAAMSPYTDMELSGAAMEENAESEGLVDRPLMEGMVTALLCGETDVRDPLANLLFADFTGYPPLFLAAGDDEMLRDDATRLAPIAKAAGVDVTLDVTPGMQHVFQCLAGRTADGDDGVRAIAAWLRPRLTA